MKTKVLQASLAYLPEDFVRHGRLTEKIDIFGCGIVGCLFSFPIRFYRHLVISVLIVISYLSD